MRRDFSSCFRGTTFAINFGRGSNVFIQLMTDAECREALDRTTIGRLACAKDQQPYVVPIYFMIDGDHLYSFANLGQKIEWMRANPRVCVEIDERVAHDRWQSVIAFGEYEELMDLPKYAEARKRAHKMLQQHAMWWEPACVACKCGNRPHAVTPIFYRININSVTGHRAMPNEVDSSHQEVEQNDESSESWWAQILHHIGL